MGGLAVKNIRRLDQNEMQPTYEWVETNVLPILGLDKQDAMPIGSFGKKPKNETSGDIDVAINARKYINEGLKFEEISTSINLILKEHGFETTLLKGFDQVSIRVPINGNESKGFAQVDLMPSPDLKWAKFMYHSPNLAEQESKYNGAVRNALLMAIISESTKNTTKLFERKAEEYESLAIRFPTGVWNIKRSFMGKKGKLVNQGVILESEFITRDPQDVIDLALGEGYKVGVANSFETLWEVIHRKNYLHKRCLYEIMTKFKANLKSMRQNIPEEALSKYSFLNEALTDILQPKSEKEVISSALDKINAININVYNDWGVFDELQRHDVLKLLPKDLVHDKLIAVLDSDRNWFRKGIEVWFREREWIYNYLSKDEVEQMIIKYKFNEFKRKNPEATKPQTLKDMKKLEADFKIQGQKEKVEDFLHIIKGNLPFRSIHKIIDERIKRNQFTLIVKSLLFFEKHKTSYKLMAFIMKAFDVADGKTIPRSEFGTNSTGEQWGIEFIDNLIKIKLFVLTKQGNKMFVSKNPEFKENKITVSQKYYDTLLAFVELIEKYKIKDLYESLLSEEFLGYAKMSNEYEDMVGIYKNPDNVKNFGPNVKAIVNIDGDMFVEDIPEYWLHKQMAEKLKMMGHLFWFGDFYDNLFVTMMRIGTTNAFGLTEGTERTMEVVKVIEKAQRKNPNLKLFAKHYEEVRL